MLKTTDHGAVRELCLARPPVNAIDPVLIQTLRTALAQARTDRCQAVVLSGAPGVFSAGLDVPTLLTLDRAQMRATWVSFFHLLEDLARFEVPLGAALTGHSPAGGTVLALFADRRVLAEGPFLVGLNEVQVGLPVPAPLHRALVFLVGERHAARLAMGGLLIGPDEALKIGLCDEVAPPAEVVPRTIAWATDLLTRPATALATTRRLVRQPLIDAFAAVDESLIDRVVEAWFSPETQTVLQGLAARLGKKR